MFRACIIRFGKWKEQFYNEDRIYGDFQNLADAIDWVSKESKEFRGGWNVVTIIIKEVTNV